MLIVLVDVVLVEGLTDLTLGCNRGRSTPPLETGFAIMLCQCPRSDNIDTLCSRHQPWEQLSESTACGILDSTARKQHHQLGNTTIRLSPKDPAKPLDELTL